MNARKFMTPLSRSSIRLVLVLLFACGALAAQQPQAPSPQAQSPAAPASPANPAASPAPPASPAKPKLTLEQIAARLPQRVTSKDGKPGDMVNFLLIGSQQQVQTALQNAGWVAVDRNVQDALSHALSDVLAHRAYSQMPMSPLYLFGRPQDFGFAEGIPLEIVQNRNHFRLWVAPWLTQEGETVWVGAGTHDLGFERDSAGQLTHAIDPDVDHERDYILQTLVEASAVEQKHYLTPKDPLRQGLTATGDKFTSDGRVLAIYLK